MKKNILVMIMILIFGSMTCAELNTLRENQLIYKSGLQFQDSIHPAVGASLSGEDVCHQDLIGSVYCNTPYGQYWQEFAQNGATIGTLNVTLVREQGLEEDFKILLSGIVGEEMGTVQSDASGFAVTGVFDDFGEMPKHTGTEGGTINFTKQRGSFTYLQAGVDVFGSSIWARYDVDTNEAAINAFQAVDWALNPVGPEPLGINAFSVDGSASERVLIGDYFEVNPSGKSVKIHKSGSNDCNTFGTGTHQGGLCVEGDVAVDSVIGKIGLITSAVNVQSINHNIFDVNNANYDGLINEFPITLDTKGAVSGSGNNYMIAYVGFVSVQNYNKDPAFQYWMQVSESSSTCDRNLQNNREMDAELGNSMVLYSTKGEYDYQAWNANTAASFQFVIIERIKDYTDTKTRKVRMCSASSSSQGGHSVSQTVTMTSGVLVYGLPTGQ